MKNKLIIANWKSNKNLASAKEWLEEFSKSAGKTKTSGKEVAIAPPFDLLEIVKENLPEGVVLAVQDMSAFPAGSYTGEVGISNLKGFDIRYAIVGHSERRHYQKETDLDVANKVERALEAGIAPIVCIDEPYLISQARAIESKNLGKCVVAYEPISAIGTGDEMRPEKVLEVVGEVRKHFGEDVRVIYGGSVDTTNVGDYFEICDGVLVGGASLKVQEFLKLI